jgi:hypothetical protein
VNGGIGAGRPRAVAIGACGLAVLLGLAAWLVPWGSYPVGFDVFRSLLVARAWAQDGFPQALPQFAFTGLDQQFADPQLAFDALLALCGGSQLDTGLVAPMIWTLVVLQGAVFWGCLRLLRPEQTPAWILLLPVVSEVWLFRCTELRSMQLAILFLLPLVAVTAARARGGQQRSRRPHAAWLCLCTAGYAYSHAAVEVPLLLWLLGAIGARLENGRGSFPWRDGGCILAGLAAAAVLRPDFPANLRLWTVANGGLVLAKILGTVRVLPAELLPLHPADLIAVEWPFLLLAGCAIGSAVRAREGRRWSLLLPAALLVAGALSSRRMFEMAAPALLLALAAGCRWRPHVALAAALCALGCWIHVPRAAAGAAGNRVPELQQVADWLRGRARPGDLVFVTDWAASSALGFFLQDRGVRFSGGIDPVLMWAARPDLWREWEAVKEARAADPIATARERFGARFLVFSIADAPAGLPPGTTANAIEKAMGPAKAKGQIVEPIFAVHPDRLGDPRNWMALELRRP